MKPEDPKFTAYVFDELSPDEYARVLQEIEGDDRLADEADELQRFAESLRAELKSEQAESLTPEQRAAILGEPLPSESNIIARGARWWRSPWLASAAAAVVVGGFVSAIYFQAKHIEKLTAERSIAHDFVQELPSIEQINEKKDAGDLADTSVSLEILDPYALALTSDHTPALKAWSPQPDAVAFKDITASNAAPVPELFAGTEITAAPEPSPIADAISLPQINAAPSKQAATSRSRTLPSPARRSVASSAPQSGGDYDSQTQGTEAAIASGTTSGTQPQNVVSRDREKRLTTAERKIQKELGDLQQRLESLEKLQRRNVKENAKDPVLKQTVEHVRRTLTALQSGQDGVLYTETYDSISDNPFFTVKDNQLSTFSVDVDTASFTNVRRFLQSNQRPPSGAVRIEELLNYFRFDYPQPTGKDPFACLTEVADCPWAPNHRLVRIGIQAREITKDQRPPANLVFLVDVSGSMAPDNKLPLVKQCLRILADQLDPQDTVAIAVYAGAAGCVLEPTNDMAKVAAALDQLEAGGPANGASGIQLAYDLAQRAFKRGSSNRVILCTDGDFNVGLSDQSQLVALIQDKAKTGVHLSVLGFGFGNLKDSTLENLASKGKGSYGYVDSLAEGRRLFVEQITGSLVTVANDVKLQVEFNPAKVAAYRLIGYENQILSKEDFNDDQKEAGAIGAGHAITALYELIPVSEEAPIASAVDELKYGPRFPDETEESPELLTVKIRYKRADSKTSFKLEFPLTDAGARWEQSTRDFRWAAAVAGFGMLLRESPYKGSLSWAAVEEMATEGRNGKHSAERAAFVQLIEKAKALSR